MDDAERQELKALWQDASGNDKHKTYATQDDLDDVDRQVAYTHAVRSKFSAALSGHTSPSCAGTGDGSEPLDLCQDPAPGTGEVEDVRSPIPREGTHGASEALMCNAPTSNRGFQHLLDCSACPMDLQDISESVNQPPFSYDLPAATDPGGLSSEKNSGQSDLNDLANVNDDDYEVTVSGDEHTLNPIEQGTAPASATLNISRITGHGPVSGLARVDLINKSPMRGSIAAPVTGSSASATWTHARHNQAGQSRKRNNRSDSSKDVDNDTPNDDDYVHADNGASGMETQPRPAKRRRQTRALASPSRRKRCTASLRNQSSNQSRTTNLPDSETIHVQGCLIRKISLAKIEYYCCFTEIRGTPFVPGTVFPSLDQNCDQPPQTSLHNIETVSIRGLFTRDPSQRRIVYSCSFTEESDLPTFNPVTEAESDSPNDVGDTGYDELRSTAKASTHTSTPNSIKGMPFSPEEDTLLISLKADGLSWSATETRFPGRTRGSLQVRYCTKMKSRISESSGKQSGPARSMASPVRPGLESDRETCTAESAAPNKRYGPPRSRCSVNRYSPG